MAADTKALRTRIRSVDSTLHLTRAMGLVASSKTRRANTAMQRGREYASAVTGLIDTLTACPECAESPFLHPREDTSPVEPLHTEAESSLSQPHGGTPEGNFHTESGAESPLLQPHKGARTRLIVIAADRGFCGGHNGAVFRLAESCEGAEILPIGRRSAARYGGDLASSSEHYTRAEGFALATRLAADFESGLYDRLGLVSSRYLSAMAEEAALTWVLPLTRREGGAGSVLFEPDAETVLNAAVPEYLFGLLMAAVRESFACEVAARRMAMDSAGKNAQQMKDDLALQYNRARQSAITQEITEIVAGSGE